MLEYIGFNYLEGISDPRDTDANDKAGGFSFGWSIALHLRWHPEVSFNSGTYSVCGIEIIEIIKEYHRVIQR